MRKILAYIYIYIMSVTELLSMFEISDANELIQIKQLLVECFSDFDVMPLGNIPAEYRNILHDAVIARYLGSYTDISIVDNKYEENYSITPKGRKLRDEDSI